MEAAIVRRGAPVLVSVKITGHAQWGGFTLAPGDWANAIQFIAKSSGGLETLLVTEPDELPQVPVSVGSRNDLTASFWLSPDETKKLVAGQYSVVARLSIAEGGQGWTGSASSKPIAFEVIDRAPDDPEERRAQHLDVINYHQRRNELDKALAETDAWVSEEPSAFYSHAARGTVLAGMKRDSEALVELNLAADLWEPLRASAHLPPPFLGVRMEVMTRLSSP